MKIMEFIKNWLNGEYLNETIALIGLFIGLLFIYKLITDLI